MDERTFTDIGPKLFRFIKTKYPYVVSVLSVENYSEQDRWGFYSTGKYLVTCNIEEPSTDGFTTSTIRIVEKNCLVNIKEFKNWLAKEEAIKWIN